MRCHLAILGDPGLISEELLSDNGWWWWLSMVVWVVANSGRRSAGKLDELGPGRFGASLTRAASRHHLSSVILSQLARNLRRRCVVAPVPFPKMQAVTDPRGTGALTTLNPP